MDCIRMALIKINVCAAAAAALKYFEVPTARWRPHNPAMCQALVALDSAIFADRVKS
jgi:hypothetical protein